MADFGFDGAAAAETGNQLGCPDASISAIDGDKYFEENFHALIYLKCKA